MSGAIIHRTIERMLSNEKSEPLHLQNIGCELSQTIEAAGAALLEAELLEARSSQLDKSRTVYLRAIAYYSKAHLLAQFFLNEKDHLSS